MKVTLPYPPSGNRMWRLFRGRAVKSAKVVTYNRLVAQAFRCTLGPRCVPIQGPVAVRLEIHRPMRRGDLDNRVKVLLDAMEGLAFVDDEQVAHLEARRFEATRQTARVEVEIEPDGMGFLVRARPEHQTSGRRDSRR